MSKLKLVVSDFHLGKGISLQNGAYNHLEDFLADRVWCEFLNYYSTGKYKDYEIELILNGDIFNSIQVDYKGYYSPIVTESIAVEKIAEIIKGHPSFFEGLKNFASFPNHTITYIVGNHDIEFIWDKCKDLLEKTIESEIKFRHISYQVDGIHYEHGQQYESVNSIDPKKLFLTKDLKEPILNLPWGSHFVINFVIPMKHERPAIDKARPISAFIKWSLYHDTFWALKTLLRALFYFIGTRFSKSIYRTNNIVTTFKIFKELLIRPHIEEGAQKIFKENPDIHTVIMGHTHDPAYIKFGENQEYINTGTWTEVTSLRVETLGKHTKYTYAIVDYSVNPKRPYAKLKEWRGRWHENVDYYAA